MKCWYCGYEPIEPRADYWICPECGASTVEPLPKLLPPQIQKVKDPIGGYSYSPTPDAIERIKAEGKKPK